MQTLEPLEPTDALTLYLSEKRTEVSDATLYSHKSRLGHFIRWCDERDLDNLNELTGRDIHRYKLWRRDDGDLNAVTLKTQMDTLRVFVRWCESIDGVPMDLSTKVQSPVLTNGENERDVLLDNEIAEAILAYLDKYDYASTQHVTLALLWHTMMRRGAVRALDLEDYDHDNQLLLVRHRPNTGTAIKNKQRGERMVALSEEMCDLLEDWIATQRPAVTDEYGREPLLTTAQGRIHGQTIQGYVYAVSRPCVFAGECPEGRDPETCEATENSKAASKCPVSVSPHAVRRGSITHWLQHDVPMRVVSDRANVSQDVLDKHYDRRTEREKVEQRRRYLNNIM